MFGLQCGRRCPQRPPSTDCQLCPVCENPPSGEPLKVYAAGVGRAVNISCRVLASPPSVRFSWCVQQFVSSERLPGDQVFTYGRSAGGLRLLHRLPPNLHLCVILD
ncbi:hypothetical protein GWK47_036992 [Chionoecetes opilio]|uniref:Ig-like domain-containing protein n=1 Tax=Chionoecetes opilio TaxID=41210 RepID=A0A8J4YFD9_CHIOP|nr:hypothetical protein GWK47_036992 [Chionoecetes opilio]